MITTGLALLLSSCIDVRNGPYTMHVQIDPGLVQSMWGAMREPAPPHRTSDNSSGVHEPDPVPAPVPLGPITTQKSNQTGSASTASSPSAHTSAHPGQTTTSSSRTGSSRSRDRTDAIAGDLVADLIGAVVVGLLISSVDGDCLSPDPPPPYTFMYTLVLDNGPLPEQVLHIRDGHSVRLDQPVLDALGHESFRQTSLQVDGAIDRFGVVVEVEVEVDANVLHIRRAAPATSP